MEVRTYYREHADPEVKGFTIIERTGENLRVAERWHRPDGEKRWTNYWITVEKLEDRIENEQCEKAGRVTEEQLSKICKRAGAILAHPEEPEEVAA